MTGSSAARRSGSRRRARRTTLTAYACTGRVEPTATGSSPTPEGRVFFFFSNRLGCLGSLLVSVLLTLVVIALLRR